MYVRMCDSEHTQMMSLNTMQSQEGLLCPLSLYVHIRTWLAASATNPSCGHVLTIQNNGSSCFL